MIVFDFTFDTLSERKHLAENQYDAEQISKNLCSSMTLIKCSFQLHYILSIGNLKIWSVSRFKGQEITHSLETGLYFTDLNFTD